MLKSATARLEAYGAPPVPPKTKVPGARPTQGVAGQAVGASDGRTRTLAKLGGAWRQVAQHAPVKPAAAAGAVRTLGVTPQNQFDGTDRNACGTTSLAMIMAYFHPGRPGNNHSAIDREIRRADLFSTPDNLARYAESHGLRASVKSEASLADLAYAIDRGLPVQVVIDPDGDRGDFVTHFVVVEGYETDAAGKITKVRISDPAGARKYTLDANTFMKRWSDLHYGNVPSGMSRMMITYAPKDNRPITGLDGVTRRANDIRLPGNSLLHDIFSNSTPARTLGNGVSDVVSGGANVRPGTFLGGLVKTIGGGVGYALGLGGRYAQRGGQAAIDWGKKLWRNGGLGGKLVGGLAIAGGAVAKGAGWAVQKVGNAAAWVAGKVGDGIRVVGDAIGNGVKKVAGAVASGVKSAGKAIGKGIKKVFSGW